MTRSLVVKCTWGVEREETLFQAFTVAATAAASGVQVSLWLTGDAVWHAVAASDDVELAYSPPLSQLRDAVLGAGTLSVCAQCALRRGIAERDLIEGVRLAGAATFVEETLGPDVTALVY
jgi:predicted peroxiredoxin